MIHDILLTRGLILIVVLSALVSRAVGLWETRDGKPRTIMCVAWWGAALLLLIVKLVTMPVNDDEVYWLANSWAHAHGEAKGVLPLRAFEFRPFLALGLSPSGTILAGRVSVLVTAVLCAHLAVVIARRMGQSPLSTMLMGPMLILWFAMMPMVFLRPEYFALLFFMLGLWALLAPPASWSGRASIFFAFLMLALSGSTSLRQCVFGVGALACILLYPDRISRRAAVLWAALGGMVGLAPTLLGIALGDSFKAVYYWNVVFPTKAQWLSANGWVRVSAPLLGLALAGCLYLWRKEEGRGASRTLVILWAIATVGAIWNPLKAYYSLGPWLALSILVGGAFLSGLPNSEPAYSRTRWTAALFALMGLPILWANLRDYGPPGAASEVCRQFNSQLQLIDWIDQTRAGGPVICVVPYHPIRARNAWAMWNAWLYARTPVRSLILELNPGLENDLRSCKAAVIEWEPWQAVSGMDNIMQYWAYWGLLDPERADDLARNLAEHYTPVRWDQPIPPKFGGSVFLVRKGLKSAPGVTVLGDSVILNWRKPAAHSQPGSAPCPTEKGQAGQALRSRVGRDEDAPRYRKQYSLQHRRAGRPRKDNPPPPRAR